MAHYIHKVIDGRTKLRTKYKEEPVIHTCTHID